MKKIICLFTLATICVLSAFAQKNYTSGQQSLRDNIESFLREEGYQPSIDSDGDIKFKRQGDLFFISVSDNDSSPYYVRMSKYYNYSDNITKSVINRYDGEINRYKMIKLLASDNNFQLAAEMFVTNSKAFTSVFERILRAMDAAESELADMLL